MARSFWCKRLVLSAVLLGVLSCGAGVSGAAPLGSIVEYSTGLNPGSAPADIDGDSHGNFWFTDQGTTPAIGKVTTSGTITEFPITIPGDTTPSLNGIAIGEDGNIWFADHGTVKGIGELNPATDTFSSFPVTGSLLRGVTFGPDGNLWFTDQGTTKAIGVLCLTASTLCSASDVVGQARHEYAVATNGGNTGTSPKDIILGSDGNLWFADTGTTKAIGEINPTTHVIAEYTYSGLNPGDITEGPDGNVWFTDRAGSKIGLVCLTVGAWCASADHSIHTFPTGIAGSTPEGITSGPDGNLWFSDDQVGSLVVPIPREIGEISPTTGAVTGYVVATHGGNTGSKPAAVTAGADGNVWFADKGATPAIGRMGVDTLTLQAVTIAPVEGASFSGAVATATDANPAASSSDLTCTIDWGDGSPVDTACTVSGLNGGKFSFGGSHTYTEEGGPLSVKVTVTYVDSASSTLSTTSTANVADASLSKGTLTLSGGVAGVTPGSASFAFTDANTGATAGDFSATINWGDTTTTIGTVSGPTSGHFVVTGAHQYAAAGPVPVTVMVTDDGGSTDSGSGTTTVAEALNAGKTECNGLFGGSGRDVTVRNGDVCTLIAGTQVGHNVHVHKGGALDDQGAAIGHDLHADGAVWVEIDGGGSVGHDLHVNHLTGAPAGGDNAVCDTTVGGDVEVQDNSASSPIDVGNLGACSGGPGLTVGHDLRVQDNKAQVMVGGNHVQHDIHVQNNAGGTLTGNSAGNDCQLQHDNPKIVGSGNSAGGHQNTCNSTA
jgi:streptogramin lyase